MFKGLILGSLFHGIEGAPLIKRQNIYKSINEFNNNIKDGNLERPSPDDDSMSLNVITFFIVFGSFFGVTFIFSIITLIMYYVKRKLALSEDELNRQEENQVYLELDSEEQELYFQSKDYLSSNPYYRNDLTLSQNLLIQEKGVNAWEFVRDSMLTSNDLLILNKYELNFFKKFECSTQTNLPIPQKNEVYYFESKIYSLPDPENTKISIGIGIKPYPWFRLPGRHAHSVSYDSDGYRRHNQPFEFTTDAPFPKFIEGDVIGVGYRTRSGTIFFTRNGKKLSESKIGGHIKNFKIPSNGQIFPIVGANNLCSVHVNVGQMGFNFIEGQVKKWGFAPLEGSGPAPPAYNKFNGDILLERSEIDENELSERENDFPPDFWQTQSDDEYDYNTNDKFSFKTYSDVNSTDERITLNSLMPPIKPPSYSDEEDNQEEIVAINSEEFEAINSEQLDTTNSQQATQEGSSSTTVNDQNLISEDELPHEQSSGEDEYSEHFQTVNEISEADLPDSGEN
ncbi:protein Ear1p [[Candida] jaroonii]|uniref:Protein Ear1p n=1 Tax=[Candida] jaroonii TaxID=467808 RepID=A0ACA9YCB9_9ASCO|nr:protein Ear1p [[Candida] jaroonii]